MGLIPLCLERQWRRLQRLLSPLVRQKIPRPRFFELQLIALYLRTASVFQAVNWLLAVSYICPASGISAPRQVICTQSTQQLDCLEDKYKNQVSNCLSTTSISLYKQSIRRTRSANRSLTGLAPIFPYTIYHLTHYWSDAADIHVANGIPAHCADAIRYSVRTPPQGTSLLSAHPVLA